MGAGCHMRPGLFLLCSIMATQVSCGLGASEQRGGSGPALYCLRADAPPTIDGRLDDRCWSRAYQATGFAMVPSAAKVVRAEPQTTVRALYDARGLYLGVVCQEPQPGRIRRSTRRPWDADDVEIFFDTADSQREYYQFCIAAQGLCAVMQRSRGGVREVEADYELARAVQNGTWSFELAIPWRALKRSEPKRLETWGFNVGRIRFASGDRELSSWARVGMFNRAD